MRTIRGMFRLSIVAAILAALYALYNSARVHNETAERNYAVARTLECGSRVSEDLLRPFANEFGNIDLSKVGCSDGHFFASFDELREARRDPDKLRWDLDQSLPPAFDAYRTTFHAIEAFLAVNFLGLAIVGARAMFRWIAHGFKPAHASVTRKIRNTRR